MGGSIDVKPHSLQAAGGIISTLSSDVRTVAATPAGTGDGIGDPACSGAFAEMLRLVGSETVSLASWLDDLSTKVTAAGAAYTRTDGTVIPPGGRMIPRAN